MRIAADLIGQTFARLTVVAFLRTNPNQQRIWKCRCRCGRMHEVSTSHLRSGAVRSCGCLNDEGRRNKHPPLRTRFWDRVDKSGECWLWFGKIEWDGYGRVKYKGKSYRAHRVAWELVNGEIEDGLLVLHRCDNPLCCNPSHLFLGTQQDNMTDKKQKGRATGRRKLAS